jgi:two-component system nitrogen regulation sensor histidine kinase NtrY
MAERKQRKATVAILAGAFLLLLLPLAALNAFNLPFLRAHSTGQIFLFTALSVLVFLLFVMLLVLLSRNILKLYADQRSRVLGSRLRSRMLVGALVLSFAPALFMFLFSYFLLNRSNDRWFSQPVSELRDDSTRIALELSHYAAGNARAESESIASSDTLVSDYRDGKDAALLNEIRLHRITLQGGFAIVYRDGAAVSNYGLPNLSRPAAIRAWLDDGKEEPARPNESLTDTILRAAQRSDEPVIAAGESEYALGTANVASGGFVVVGIPMPSGLSSTIAEIRTGASEYWAIYRERRTIRSTYLLLLLLLTSLTFFASSWLALYLSKQITRPVEALADAMNEIAEGHYQQRVTVSATEELGELVRSFNHMAADLEASRNLAESSTHQLSKANTALEERRRELETILETIPSGVVTLDAERRILQTNRAFLDLLEPRQQAAVPGVSLHELLPADIADEIARLARRAQRMGVAATEFEMQGPKGMLSLSATVALLHLGRDRRGWIVVLEDVTEFIRAQRQVAWKEVAQRVAHEIKNPLTPIGLSAERIRRHIDRNTAESPGVIRRCTEVILGSVETMRRLVDQFAALAQFPSAQPRPADLNLIVESALMLFAGRLEGIHIMRHLSPGIPPVMADPEALKRALANLIDNAAEAMQGSLLRELTIETALVESHGTAEVILSDTGHGLTDEMRERLFLPYFSTKQRGTGLGLSIAAKIVQDHQGTIRAERNAPAGARFIIDLPLAETTNGVEATATGNGRTSV